jgi:nucleotide-binding universal stress UspA family protein
MMIKDVLVKLEHDKSRDSVRDYAVSIAETFGAHVVGVSFAQAAIPSFVLADVPSDVLAAMLAENEAAARGAIDRFQEAVKRSNASTETRLVAESEIGPPDAFSAMARRFDLSVVMQSDHRSGAHNDLIIEGALFDSGRPLIVVPYIQKDGMKLQRIVCCWDGSCTAARAINDALPVLKKAKSVELFIVANDKTRTERELRGADIAQHLARHDVKIEVEVMPAADIDVASVILSHTADCSADMIVMGGYGHSRLREFMLGGVTRGILETMTIPVFMSH